MSSRWVTFFQGSIPEVITLQASCESIGIPTYVPDMNLIQADPFMRGGNALALQLFVPEDRLDDARAFQERLAKERRSDPERMPREPDPLERLGRRVRWACLLWLTAPLGIWLGLRYIHATRNLVRKPDQHSWSIVAFWCSIVVTLANIVVIAKMIH
jgi:hypothetical protein